MSKRDSGKIGPSSPLEDRVSSFLALRHKQKEAQAVVDDCREQIKEMKKDPTLMTIIGQIDRLGERELKPPAKPKKAQIQPEEGKATGTKSSNGIELTIVPGQLSRASKKRKQEVTKK